MAINEAGIALIKKWEGCRLTAYKDTAGIRTIGYGHAYWTGPDRITQAEADALLVSDIAKHEQYVQKYQSVYNFNENEYAALVSFAFNVGSIKQLTNDGKRTREEILEHIIAYNKSGGRYYKGLEDRRKEEKALFLKPVTDESNKVAVKSEVPNFIIGKKYTLQTELRVRSAPSLSGRLVGHLGLSSDGQKHDKDKDGCLDAGTVITCISKVVDNLGNVWIKCPSGWVCAYEIKKDKVYIK